MASEIRVNSITNRSGLSTVTFSDTGVVLSGISTFSTGIVVAAGSTSAPSISPSGDSNTGIFFPSADTIAFAEGGVEALRIDSSSNVGIGTAVPSQKLEVVGGEIKAGRVDSTNEGGQVSFGRATDNATGWYLDVYGNTSTPSLRFVDVSNSAVRATIDGSGRFTTPYQPAFNVTGAEANVSYSSGAIFQFSSANLNVGNHFNTSTYKFTAPVAGVYLFGASIYVNGNLSGCFTVNGTQTYGGGDVQPLLYTSTVISISAQLLVSLSANDVVDFRSRDVTASATIYMGHSNFWGYLMG